MIKLARLALLALAMLATLFSGTGFAFDGNRAGFILGWHAVAEPDAQDGATAGEISPIFERRAKVAANRNARQLLGIAEDEATHRADDVIRRAKVAAGPNANARLSLDLIPNGGAGNRQNDGVTSGTVSGRGTTIAIEVFATGVTTSLVGMQLRFDFDASLVTFVKAENSAFSLPLPQPTGTDFAATPPVRLASSGFLTRAEFTTVTDVAGREFSIGIASVMISESQSSSDTLTTTSRVEFNAMTPMAPTPDFDGDGMVGFPDFLAFAGQYGAQRGDGRYRAKYDLNSDSAIDFSDFLLFVSSYGTRVSPPGGGGSETVVISDANLRAVISDSLGKARGAPITRADMATLRRIEARNANINNLTGLEFATELTLLDLGGEFVVDTIINSNAITDLAPLQALTSLDTLDLDRNAITDIAALSGLTNLEWLSLGGNIISDSDISVLSGLTNLTVLYLHNGQISDIAALSRLTNLEELDLSNNQISDIAALSRLTNLERLWLSNNQISDIAALSRLTSLTVLNLRNNQISDIAALSRLTSLIVLSLSNNQISDIVSLSGLTNLKLLWLYNNPLSATSINTYIPALQTREVLVTFNSSGGNGGGVPPKLYWTDWSTDKIQRANLDGSNIEDLVTAVSPLAIALDVGRGKMYWTDNGTDKIQRANLDGSNVEDLILITTGLESPVGIALDVGRGKMYWVDSSTDKIQRANLDGSNVEDLITTGLEGPFGIALDVGRGKMYWTDRSTDKIQRANLDGSNVEDLITTGLEEPVGIALDVGRGKMYWTDNGTDKIQRANLGGGNIEDLVTGLGTPVGIALDVGRDKMYWVDQHTNKIQRANLDGSNVEDLITTGLERPFGIALDTSGPINDSDGGGSDSLGACSVWMVVRPNQSCQISGGEFRNVGGGCFVYTPSGNGRFCTDSFNLNGFRGIRVGNDYRIDALP